ncbi:MAG: type II toxin-antitoxin system VapC family toxin [Myxococcales bacterium]|nr:type II toxin-antitoxin system VapC family toxin [Myxococcales bacterium]MCB9540509.1 type II toxin-antitoxin system VapC family toxin [Myxococcales bacterium]
MVIDTSAVIAILAQEDDAHRLGAAIQEDDVRLMSAATLTEAGIVATVLFGEGGAADLDDLLNEMQVEIVPLTEDHARLARQAFVAFGKGRHPARLNFGDCFAYALAKASGHALLFKGNDFSHTDVEGAPVRVESTTPRP